MRLLSVFLGVCLVFADLATAKSPCKPTVSNKKSSLTLLYQNNLNLTDDVNHASAFLLDAMPASEASEACAALQETVLSRAMVEAHESDFFHQLRYQEYAGRYSQDQLYLVNDGTVSVNDHTGRLVFSKMSPKPAQRLPVLCTQASDSGLPETSMANPANEIKVDAGGNTFVGFRNQKSFRFQGIRYAEPPKRWEYTTLYQGKGEIINATTYGPQCIQVGSGGSEDCLYLNIQSPYIPKAGSKKNLRPVLFWIHGGGFTGGVGSASNSDGGQYASREDVVTVTMNYRLSTVGFLAVPGTDKKGNYGIADQHLALQWTVKNIEKFGGDPNQITLNGGSAGAASVRVMLGSPPSIGKFQGSIAMSNLGGGQDLGLTGGDYSTQYSAYPTIQGSYNLSKDLFSEAGCNQTDVAAQVACLRTVDGGTLNNLATVARYVVQDGHYVNTPDLVVSSRNPNTAHVPVMFGNAENDGASFSTYPRPPVTSELQGIEASLGISKYYAQSIIDSKLFPYYDTGNVTLDSFNVSQRVATDQDFRCIDQASAYAGAKTGAFESAYYYEATRTGYGYDPNGLGGAPVTPGYPYGNPNLPYFRLHGSDQDWAFGYLSPIREPKDLWSVQLSMGYYAEFIRSRQPNPSAGYLKARGYDRILEITKESGPWEKIKDARGPIQILDWPSQSAPFVDLAQCNFLNYSIEFYLDGGH